MRYPYVARSVKSYLYIRDFNKRVLFELDYVPECAVLYECSTHIFGKVLSIEVASPLCVCTLQKKNLALYAFFKPVHPPYTVRVTFIYSIEQSIVFKKIHFMQVTLNKNEVFMERAYSSGVYVFCKILEIQGDSLPRNFTPVESGNLMRLHNASM